MFGLTRHPSVGEPPVPLILALTSPAHRPIQTTRDIASFWGGSWHDVAREMPGRYPRPSWPDAPASARPTLLTQAAPARRGEAQTHCSPGQPPAKTAATAVIEDGLDKTPIFPEPT